MSFRSYASLLDGATSRERAEARRGAPRAPDRRKLPEENGHTAQRQQAGLDRNDPPMSPNSGSAPRPFGGGLSPTGGSEPGEKKATKAFPALLVRGTRRLSALGALGLAHLLLDTIDGCAGGTGIELCTSAVHFCSEFRPGARTVFFQR